MWVFGLPGTSKTENISHPRATVLMIYAEQEHELAYHH